VNLQVNDRGAGAAALSRAESVTLLTAAVARIAAVHGIRLIVLKGIASTVYDLRPERVSADVDVLVPERDFDSLLALLTDRGWIARHQDPDTTTFPRHSESLFHTGWGVDLDLHFRFPGIELPNDATADSLWLQRTTLWCGDQPVALPGLADAVLVAALHSLRSLRARRHAEELDFLVERCVQMDHSTLVRRATELHALATARPFLERIGVEPTSVDWGEPSAEWMLRTRVADPMERRALTWSRASARERARHLRLALFPPATVFAKETAAGRPTGRALLAAYLRRWRRGLRALPRILPHLRRRA
jgi:hypothetical protein